MPRWLQFYYAHIHDPLGWTLVGANILVSIMHMLGGSMLLSILHVVSAYMLFLLLTEGG